MSLSAGPRRALALLAASPEGLTEALLVYAHGVPIEVLSGFDWAGADLLTRAEKLRRYIKTEQMVREAEKALDDVFEMPPHDDPSARAFASRLLREG